MQKCDFKNQDDALDYVKNLRQKWYSCVDDLHELFEGIESLAAYIEDDNTKKKVDEIKKVIEDIDGFNDEVLSKYQWGFEERVCIDD